MWTKSNFQRIFNYWKMLMMNLIKKQVRKKLSQSYKKLYMCVCYMH